MDVEVPVARNSIIIGPVKPSVYFFIKDLILSNLAKRLDL